MPQGAKAVRVALTLLEAFSILFSITNIVMFAKPCATIVTMV